MIVGVAHLVARRDVHNAVFQDSPLSPARQKQIADVVSRLAAFHPTKVVVEAPMGDPGYAKEYREFIAHHWSLPANEVYQFGFRLAAASQNTTILTADTWGPSLVESDAATARINSYLQANFNKVPDADFDAVLKHEDELERDGTYLDLLRYLNSDVAIRANASVYSVLAGMGHDVAQAGAEYTAQWYTRNVYIYSNIVSLIQPGDRVVVLFGQGHEYLLRELVRLNPNLDDVDALQYLNG